MGSIGTEQEIAYFEPFSGDGLVQPFTTGPEPGGYSLGSVAVFASGLTTEASVDVEIRADDSGSVGALLHFLITPQTFSQGRSTFVAPPGSTLEPSTTYHAVVVIFDKGARGGGVAVTRPEAGVVAAPGWTLAGTHRALDTNGAVLVESGQGNRLMIEVSGSVISGPPGPPGPPGDVEAEASATTTQLSWSAPTSDGGIPVTGYAVEVSVTGGATWEDLARDTGDTSTSHSHTHPSDGVVRRYRVSAINALGRSVPSEATPVQVIRRLTGNLGQSFDLLIPLGGEETRGLILAQEFTTGPNPGGYLVSNIEVRISETDPESLTAGFDYARICRSLPGAGGPGTCHSIESVAGPPSAGEYVFGEGGLVRLAPLTTYFFVVRFDNDDDIVPLASTESAREDEGGAAGWRIANELNLTRTLAGWRTVGGESLLMEVRGLLSHSPGRPANLRATAYDGWVELAWTQPTGGGAPPVAGYTIEASDDGGASWEAVVADTGDAAARRVLPGSAPAGRLYRVVALADQGALSLPSAAVAAAEYAAGRTVASNHGRPAGAPLSLGLRSQAFTTGPVQGGGILLRSLAVELSDVDTGDDARVSVYTDAAGLPGQALYELHRPLGLSGGRNVFHPAGSAPLEGSTTYHVVVEPRPGAGIGIGTAGDGAEDPGAAAGWSIADRSGAGAGAPTRWSDGGPALKIAVNAASLRPPGPPQGLEGTLLDTSGTTTAEVRLSWDPPGDDGGLPITGYRIEMSLNRGETWTVTVESTLSGESTSHDLTFERSGRVHFRVLVISEGGVSGPSEPVNLFAAADADAGVLVGNLDGDASTGTPYTVQTGDETLLTALGFTTGPNPGGYEVRELALDLAEGSSAAGTHRLLISEGTPQEQVQSSSGFQAQVSVSYETIVPATGGVHAWRPFGERTHHVKPSTKYYIYFEGIYDLSGNTNFRLAGDTDGASDESTGWSIDPTITDCSLVIGGTERECTFSTSTAAFRTEIRGVPLDGPSSPTDVRATGYGSSAVLDWRPPAREGSIPVDDYSVEMSEDGGATWETVAEGTRGDTRAVLPGPAAGSDTRYRVTALTAAGSSEPSEAVRVADAALGSTMASNQGQPESHVTQTPALRQGQAFTTGPNSDGYVLYSVEVDFRQVQRERVFAYLSRFPPGAAAPDAGRHELIVPPGEIRGRTLFHSPEGVELDPDSRYIVVLHHLIDDDDTFTYENMRRTVSLSEDPGGLPGWEIGDLSHVEVDPGEWESRHGFILKAGLFGEALGPPEAPAGLGAEAVSRTEIELSWEVAGELRGAPNTGYRIEVSGDGAAWRTLVEDTAGPDTRYSHTGLTAGKTLHYRVLAISRLGLSEPSAAVPGTPLPPVRPGPPTGLAARRQGTVVALFWMPPADDGGAPPDLYRVELSENGGGSWRLLATATDLRYEHGDTAAGGSFHYRVLAHNSSGHWSPPSSMTVAVEDGGRAVRVALDTVMSVGVGGSTDRDGVNTHLGHSGVAGAPPFGSLARGRFSHRGRTYEVERLAHTEADLFHGGTASRITLRLGAELRHTDEPGTGELTLFVDGLELAVSAAGDHVESDSGGNVTALTYAWDVESPGWSEGHALPVRIEATVPDPALGSHVVKAEIAPDGAWHEYEMGRPGPGVHWFATELEVDHRYRISLRRETEGLTGYDLANHRYPQLLRLSSPGGIVKYARDEILWTSPEAYVPGGRTIDVDTSGGGDERRIPGVYYFEVSAPHGLSGSVDRFRYWVKVEGSTEGITQRSYSEARSTDFPYTQQTRGRIVPGDPATGRSPAGSDGGDMFRIELEEGMAYLFGVSGESGPLLNLFAESSHAGELPSAAREFSYAPPQAGTYFVGVHSGSLTGDHRYEISVSSGTPLGADLWTATMEPGGLLSDGASGYCAPKDPSLDSPNCVVDGHDPHGSLDDGEFSIGEQAFTVGVIRHHGGRLRLALDAGLQQPELSRMLLLAGPSAFRLSGARAGTVQFPGGERLTEYSWPLGAAPWAFGEPVALRLTAGAAGNSPATGRPAIEAAGGAPGVGAELTVDTSSIKDADGMTGAAFEYRWQRLDGDLAGDIYMATGASYRLTAAEAGKRVRVRVAFTDDAGNRESLTSEPTGAVRAAPAEGRPVITGPGGGALGKPLVVGRTLRWTPPP